MACWVLKWGEITTSIVGCRRSATVCDLPACGVDAASVGGPLGVFVLGTALHPRWGAGGVMHGFVVGCCRMSRCELADWLLFFSNSVSSQRLNLCCCRIGLSITVCCEDWFKRHGCIFNSGAQTVALKLPDVYWFKRLNCCEDLLYFSLTTNLYR